MDTATMDTTPIATPTTHNTPDTDKRQRALQLIKEGKPYSVIALELNVNKSTVCRWAQNEVKVVALSLRQNATAVTRADVSRIISDKAPLCVDTIDALRTGSKSDDIKLRSAQDLLNRGGYMPVQRTANLHLIEEISPSDAREMLRTMLIERGLMSNNAVTPIDTSTNSNSPT